MNGQPALAALLLLLVVAASAQRGPRGPRGFPGARGATGSSSSSSATPIYVDRTVFVDAQFGNDTTGRVQVFDKPFKTINAAFVAASSQHPTAAAPWQVQVRPGVYNELVKLRACINLLGTSTPHGREDEVTIVGAISDSPNFDPSSTCQPQLSNLAVHAFNSPAIDLFDQAASVLLESVYLSQRCSSDYVLANGPCTAVVHFTTDVRMTSSTIFVDSPVGVLGFQTYSGATLAVSGCSIFLNGQGSDSDTFYGVFVGSGLDDGHSASSSSFFVTDRATIESNNNNFFMNLAMNATTNQLFVFQHLSGSDATSRSDQLTIAAPGPETTINSLVLGTVSDQSPSHSNSQSLSVTSMVVVFDHPSRAASKVEQFLMMQTLNSFNSSGYFTGVRLVGWTGDVPGQDYPGIAGNVFFETGTLTDAHEGGANLQQVRIIDASENAVNDVDSILLWNGTLAVGTLQLPTARSFPGRVVTVKLSWISGNQGLKTLTVLAAPGDYIDTATSLALTPIGSVVAITSFVTLASDGQQHWLVLGTGGGS